MIMLTVLVTGGSGLVGKAIERKVQGGRFLEMGIQFVFLSSKEADLRSGIAKALLVIDGGVVICPQKYH